MDALAIHRAVVPAPSAPARSPVVAAAPELPLQRAVAPAVLVDLTGGSARGSHGAGDNGPRTHKGYVEDATSKELVFQVAETASGTVLLQIPSIEVLKVRAYSRSAADGGERTDVTA
jgi:hypothetical protein